MCAGRTQELLAMPSSGLSAHDLDIVMSWLAQPQSRASREPEIYADTSSFHRERLSDIAERHGILARAESRRFPLAPDCRAKVVEQRRTAFHARTTRSKVVRRFNEYGITPILVKGAALVPWTYRDRDERTMGDVDLVVQRDQLPTAFDAIRSLGGRRPLGALPAWHVALWHFNVAWVSTDRSFLPVEIHWRLHSEAFEGAQDPPGFRERATRVEFDHVAALMPDPADLWIHIATHFASHLGCRGGSTETIALLAESSSPPARLRWVMDLVEAFESAHTHLGPGGLVRRIRETRAEAACADALAMIFPLLAPDNLAAAMAVAGALDNPRMDADALRRRGEASHTPNALLGIRVATLRTYFRWLMRPSDDLSVLGHLKHAAIVLLKTLVAGATFPIAWCQRSRDVEAPSGPSDPSKRELAAFEAHAEELRFRQTEAEEDRRLVSTPVRSAAQQGSE